MTSYDANGAPVETEAVRRFWKQTGQVPVEVGEHPDGDFVLWSDHLAAVQRLSEQLAAAKRDYAIMDETDKAYIKAAHAELASLRTQLSAATAARQWQPIETAPKDGHHLFWVVPREPDEQWLLDLGDKPLIQTWAPYVFKGRNQTWNCLSKATHWMPLPDPPARREGSGES